MFYENSLAKTVPLLKKGELPIEEYIQVTLHRLEQIDSELQAFISEENRLERLMNEASELIRQYPDSEQRPPLFGCLVGVKDLFHVQGFPTKAGSKLPAVELSGEEGTLVHRLKSAGALILGKTAMDEFAYADPSPTKNPHNLNHTPGGSSSGSATAVAVGLSSLSIGTQTSRSIIAPASFCGVFGFKPSYGRIPADGFILMSEAFDTVGYFTQDMESMLLASQVIIPDFHINKQQKEKLTIGVPDGKYMSFMMPETREVFEKKILRLKDGGHQILTINMPWENEIEGIYPRSIKLLCGEMAQVHKEWFNKYKELYGKFITAGIKHGQSVSKEELETYREGQLNLRQQLEATMEQEGIDVWITPAQADSAPEGYDNTGWGGMTIPWSYAGLPTISLPVATIKGTPLGIQCIGKFNKDEELLTDSQTITKLLL